MKRKVNRVGTSTLTVSLPSKWAKERNIKKGDELNVIFDEEALTLSKQENEKRKKEISINIDGYSYHTLARCLAVLYKTGHDKIILTYSKPEVYNPKKGEILNLQKTVKKITGRLIGAEIVSQSQKKIEIDCLITEDGSDLDKIEKRIYFLLKETTEELLSSIGPNYDKFHETIYDHHDNITKFINYFLRILYESERTQDEKKAAFVFYSIIDNVVDKIRHLSEKINQFGCTPKVKEYLTGILDLFYEQFVSISKKKIPQELVKKRYELKNKIDKETFTIKEFRVITEINICLHTLNEFSEYVITKNLVDDSQKFS